MFAVMSCSDDNVRVRDLDDTEQVQDTGDTGDAGPEADPGIRFDDPYWDDAFCAWWDPSLRTCCG